MDLLCRRFSVDWERVAAQASDWHLKVTTYLTLALAQRILGTPVPRGILDRLRPGATRRALIGIFIDSRGLRFYRFRHRLAVAQTVLAPLLADRVGGQLRFARQYVARRIADWRARLRRQAPVSPDRNAIERLGRALAGLDAALSGLQLQVRSREPIDLDDSSTRALAIYARPRRGHSSRRCAPTPPARRTDR